MIAIPHDPKLTDIVDKAIKQDKKAPEKKKLIPLRLSPPKEARDRIIQNDKKRLPLNPISRFLKVFLNEGF